MSENKCKSPEEVEYEKYCEEHEKLLEELRSKNNRYIKIQKELAKFEKIFIKTLGRRYEELDKLDLMLAEYKKQDKFNDIKYEEFFKKAEKKSKEYEVKNNFESNEKNIKEMYIDIVKEIHPDRCENEDEIESRTNLMKEINEAYSSGNRERMLTIYNNWKYDAESIKSSSIGDELIKIIRKIYMTQKEIESIEKYIEEEVNSDVYMFKKEVEVFIKRGFNPIRDMCISLDKEIQHKRKLVRVLNLLKKAAKK